MKKPLIAVCMLLPFVFGGCSLFGADVETSDLQGDYSYVYTPDTTAPGAAVTEEPASLPEETTLASETAAPETVSVAPTLPLPTEGGSAAPTVTEPTTKAAPAPTEPSLPATTAAGEVDLSITLPEANGTMEVSRDPANPFIRAVTDSRGIDPSLLAAVYAVPESGQNYVFEFKTASSRTAENLRRVYLLNADGGILSVAAANGAEKENLSATENWFCMNVLIKNMVFPAVKDRM